MAIILHRSLLRVYAPIILRTAAEAVDEEYELTLEWDGYSISEISDFTITGIRVSDSETGSEILTTESLRVRTSLLSLILRRQDPIQAVTSVEVEHPSVTISETDGKLNIEKLFREREEKPRALPGRISVSINEGTVIWQGGAVGEGMVIGEARITRLNGHARIEPDDSIGLNFEGLLNDIGDGASTFSVTGTYDPATSNLRAGILTNGIDIGYARDLLTPYGVETLHGSADVNTVVVIGPDAGERGFSFAGYADLDGVGGETEFTDMPVTNARGRIHFTDNSIFTPNLLVNVDQADVRIAGRMTGFLDGEMSAKVVVLSDNFRASTLRTYLVDVSGIPRMGNLEVMIEVEYDPDGLKAIIEANAPNLIYHGLPYSLNEFRGWFSGDSFVIDHGEIGLFGGRISGNGYVDFSGDETSYNIALSAEGLPAERIVPFMTDKLGTEYIPSGPVDGDFMLSGGNGEEFSLDGIIRAGSVAVPAYYGLPPARIELPISYDRETVRVTGGTVAASGLTGLMEGTFSMESGLSGSFAVTVDDGDIAEIITGAELRGQIASAGDFSYRAGSGFDLAGDFYLSDGSFHGISIPRLSAGIEIGSGGIRLTDVSGFMGGGEVSGDILIPTGETVNGSNGSFTLSRLNLGQLLPEGSRSALSTSLDVSGSLDYDPVEEKIILDMRIGDETARVGPNAIVTGTDGISLRVGIKTGGSGKVTLEASGRLSSTPAGAPVYRGRELTPYSSRIIDEVSAVVTGRLSGSEDIAVPVIPLVEGELAFDITLDDLFGNAYGEINLDCTGLTYGDLIIPSISLGLSSVDGIRWTTGLAVDAGSLGAFDLSGQIERAEIIADSPFSLSAAVHDSGIRDILGVLGIDEPDRTSGSIGGAGVVSGTLNDPSIDSFQLSFAESEALGIPLSRGEANFSYNAPLLQLSGISIDGLDGFRALGAGAVDLEQFSLANPNFVLRVDEFNLDVISRLTDAKFPLCGTASATVQLAHDALGMKILYDMDITGVELVQDDERVTLGDLKLRAESRPGDHIVYVEECELRKGQEWLGVTGEWVLPGNGDTGHSLNLAVVSPTGYDLPIPRGVVSDIISLNAGLGPVDLAITGDSSEPDINGSMDFLMSDIRYDDSQIIQAVNGTILFTDSIATTNPQMFRIIGDDWEMGLDGYTDLKAFMRGEISGSRLSVVQVSQEPIRLSGPGFEFDFILGIEEEAPSLNLTGTPLELSAVISGKAYMAGGEVDFEDLQPIAAPAESDEPGRFNLDVSLELSEGLRIINGNKFSFIFEYGELEATGPIDRPSLTGNIIAPTGWLDIIGNHFVLIEPLEFIFTSIYPPTDPRLVAVAQTTLREVKSPGNFEDELVITARINDRLSNITGSIDLSSNPPLSQDQILAALAYEDVVIRTIGNTLMGDSGLDSGFSGSDFSGLALPFATSYISRYIRREAGFSDFELSLDESQNVLVYLEKEVFNNFVMYYTQKFGPDVTDDYRWGARYRWRPRSWVGFEVDNDEEITPQVQYIIPIDWW